MRARFASMAILVGLIWVIAAAGPALAASVSIVDFSYSPATVTVHVGETVTWANTGQAPHSVTADGGAFDSSPGCPSPVTSCIQPGHGYSHTFTTAGTFAYHCKVHPSMHGTVVVEAATTSAPPPTSAPSAGAAPGPTVAASPLPNTGASSRLMQAVVLGVVLIAGGGGLLFAARRRRA